MKLKLKRMDPISIGKMLAALYGLMSLLFVPVMVMFIGLGAVASAQSGGEAAPLPFVFGMGLGFLLFLPLIYAAMGFVTGTLGALAYNLLARWLGGFEFEFEDAGSPPRV